MSCVFSKSAAVSQIPYPTFKVPTGTRSEGLTEIIKVLTGTRSEGLTENIIKVVTG